MTGKILDGKVLSDNLLAELKLKVADRMARGKLQPTLAVILVGENPASQIYVRNKIKACETAGMRSLSFHRPATLTESELLALIEQLNDDVTIHGILVQLPLPLHIDPETVIERIDPAKDVDGFHPYNIGRLVLKMPVLRPCTPYGVMKLLSTTGEDLRGKHAVVVGASNIVGRPMGLELLLAKCTVTTCHSATRDLPGVIRSADIVVAAVGQPQMVRGDWIREGAIVVDVGMNRLPDGKLCGDVDFEAAKLRASWITPVPGGVGPMTVATLLHNTYVAAEKLGA